MATLTEGKRTAQFLVSEANGYRSREKVTVDATGGALEAGTLLGELDDGSAYVRYDPGANDGSETVAGILYEGIGAEEAERTIINNDAEVRASDLTYEDASGEPDKDTANAGLAALGIIVR